jgi:hypothetical protein
MYMFHLRQGLSHSHKNKIYFYPYQTNVHAFLASAHNMLEY